MGFMRLLQKLWRAVRKPLVAYFIPLRFVFVPLAVLLWAMLASDEGQDAVRALVEFERRCPHWGRVALFSLLVSALALQAWYWSRQLLRIEFPQCNTDDDLEVRAFFERHPGLERWTPRILGLSAYLIAIGALIKAGRTYGTRAGYTMTVIIITCVILAVLAIAYLVYVVGRRRALAARGEAKPARAPSHHGLAPLTRGILLLTVIVALLFIILTAITPVGVGIVFQSPSLLMVSAVLWIGLGSWIVYWADFYRVPIFGLLLVLALVFSLFNDNHAVRKLTAANGGGDPAGRQNIVTTFGGWYDRLQTKYPGETPHPVIIVATEGGGIRAAYWTAAVLAALQDRAPHFADHVFAISGVSGGSVGATVFTSLVADRNRARAVADCAEENDPNKEPTVRFAAQQVLAYDALAPTLSSLLHADLVQRFLPVGFIPDRARALETGWERGWRTHIRDARAASDNYFASGFVKMYRDNAGALLPYLFLNTTSVEIGHRSIESYCAIDPSEILDSADTLSDLASDVRLSTAALNSARFTYVSPAGTVHNQGGDITGHVVDGGYFENSGAATAADIYRTLSRPGVTNGRNFQVYLILIKFEMIPTPPVPPERFANETLSPVRALLATRGARGTLAYGQAEQLLGPSRYFEFILTQEEHGGIAMPLGWLLAKRTMSAIDEQVGNSVPPDTPPSLLPYVTKNVANVKAVADLLMPPAARALPPPPDYVQQDAVKSEKAARQ
jgi:hypothetical protein